MKTRTRRTAAALVALSVLAVACGDDDSDADTTEAPAVSEAETAATEAMDEAETAATEAMDEAETAATEAMDEAAEEPGTVVDVAVASGEFPTLVAAIEAAGLVETLSGEGPFTVFAPTEEAFAAALEALDMTAEELLGDTELLTSVLTYHVLPTEATAETVVTLDGQSVATVNGAEVTITVEDDTVMVNDATVVQTDIMASNGVIHVIDTVLLPPSS